MRAQRFVPFKREIIIGSNVSSCFVPLDEEISAEGNESHIFGPFI